MALLRLIAIGLGACAALAACSSPADAQATAPEVASNLTPPPGFTAQPALATAVRDAAIARRVTVDGTEAWADPARGCYAFWLALRGEGAAAARIVAGIEAEQIAIADVVTPSTEDGVVSLAFTRAPYRGRLRARVGGGRAVGLACFANAREPASCDAACTQLLGGLP